MRWVWKETSRVLFQMGRSGQASEEVASDLRLECREFRKNIPGRGNSKHKGHQAGGALVRYSWKG